MELLSNSMATYAHIKANPESLALYFMMGVCLGLFAALCLLVTAITCRRRFHRDQRKPPAPTPPTLERQQLRECCRDEEEEEEEEGSRDSSGHLSRGVSNGTLRNGGSVSGTLRSGGGTLRNGSGGGTLRGGRAVDVFASEEELEKARRLEERERILREIWRNGQPDVLVTGTGTIGRVHYH